MIVNPVPTGQWIELKYIPGCRYVGFKAREVQHEQVNIHILRSMINLTILIIKMTEATYHESKPEYLVYLDHSFHVLDIKVILCNKMYISCNINIIISLASAILSILDV